RLRERTELRIELVEQLREDWARVVLLELLVLVRGARVPLVLELGRDEQLVDERLAETRDLLPACRCLQDLPPTALRERHLRDRPFAGRPDSDGGAPAIVQLRQRHLYRDSVHRVAAEELPAAAAGTCTAANGNEIERRTDVAE